MKTLLLLTVTLNIAFLAGCSTQTTSSYTPIVPIVQNTSAHHDAEVVIRRDVGLMGAACRVDTYLDGIKYGSLKSGQSLTIKTISGEHILSANFAGAMCPDRLSEVAVTLDKNQTKYYRLAFDASTSFSIMPTLKEPIK